jgi:hypothetical protein
MKIKLIRQFSVSFPTINQNQKQHYLGSILRPSGWQSSILPLRHTHFVCVGNFFTVLFLCHYTVYLRHYSVLFTFVSTLFTFASTVFFFVSTVLNFVSTVFFFKSYVTMAPPPPPHPPASIHVYLHYSGRGRGSPATNQPPPPEYLLTQHSYKETSPTL